MTTQRDEQVVSIGDEGAMAMPLWVPEAGTGPAILVIQEIFGVGPYIRAVAARLADAGYVVGAPDVFWRFAPGWAAGHDEAGLGASMQQVANLDPEKAVADCVAAVEHLAALPETTGRPGVLGFCLGGTLAFGVAAADTPAVCVSYYGSGVPGMLDAARRRQLPDAVPLRRHRRLHPDRGRRGAGRGDHRAAGFVLNIEAAGHAFDNHESAMFHDEAAATAAWSKTMAFLAEHLPV